MNKKKLNGFTFIEILLTITLLSAITLIVVPAAYNYFVKSKTAVMKVQEKHVSDATKVYIEDTCLNPISEDTDCLINFERDTDGFKVYSDVIDVQTIIDEGYISSIELNDTGCSGYIVIEETSNVTTYLRCGTEYITTGYEGEEVEFLFSGAAKTYTIPEAGYYLITASGAQGSGTGGKGGEVSGKIYFEEGEIITINVGGQNGYNGGGSGTYSGGGATTITYNSALLMTAAGGGGGKNGTDGGSGTATGGSFSAGTLDTPATGNAGNNGTNGGGGGSGNKYKDCDLRENVYNSCVTGNNTCVAGFINDTCSVYNNCQNSACGYATCTTSACGCSVYNSCANAACGYQTCQNSACGTTCTCPSGWTLSGTSCTKAASTRTLYRWYYRRCSCTCTYRIIGSEGPWGPYYCTTRTNSISNGTYYNTPSCASACAQKNTGTVGSPCNASKHVSGSGTCTKIYTAWQTSSTPPSTSYNPTWVETTTETYCPSGTLSGSTCYLSASCSYNTCATSACGNLTCRTSACGCQTYNSCQNSACGYATCRTSACGCQTYNQVYSSCATGENTCEGAYENVCTQISSEKYNSGNGGTSYASDLLSTVTTNTGFRSGNGIVTIKFVGDI